MGNCPEMQLTSRGHSFFRLMMRIIVKKKKDAFSRKEKSEAPLVLETRKIGLMEIQFNMSLPQITVITVSVSFGLNVRNGK